MSSNCRRRATRAAKPLRLRVGDRARHRLHTRPKERQQFASIASVFAVRPSACANALTCRGFTTDDRQAAAAHCATSARFIAARRLHHDDLSAACAQAASQAPQARFGIVSLVHVSPLCSPPSCSVALLTSIPIADLFHLCAPFRLASLPYAFRARGPINCPGSSTTATESAQAICGLEIRSFSGYSSEPLLSDREASRPHMLVQPTD